MGPKAIRVLAKEVHDWGMLIALLIIGGGAFMVGTWFEAGRGIANGNGWAAFWIPGGIICFLVALKVAWYCDSKSRAKVFEATGINL